MSDSEGGFILVGALLISLAVIIASVMSFISVDPNVETVIDDGAMISIDFAHYEIHEGDHFKAGYQDITLNVGDTIELLFTTPNTTKLMHWTLTAQGTGGASVIVYENTTTSNDGIVVKKWNRYRDNTNAGEMIVTYNPTIISNGSKMSEKWFDVDDKTSEIDGSTRGSSEFILKRDTKYLVRLTANSNGMKGGIGGDWYEHTFD